MVREYKINTGEAPEQINNGSCEEFADDLAEMHPDMFQSISIGEIMKYGGEYNDKPIGYDEQLLKTHWPMIKPPHGLTWDQIFNDVGLDWPGTHCWAFCKQTGLSYDAVTPQGVSNPFDLSFFKPYFDDYFASASST